MGVACCHGFAMSVIDGCCLLPPVKIITLDLPGSHKQVLIVAIYLPGQSQTGVVSCHIFARSVTDRC